MIRQNYKLQLITPCFCAGAEPEKQAEIRAASIRGQLRWWFRVLGGFKALHPMGLREQEDLIFGSTAGDKGRAGLLTVRVSGIAPSFDIVDDQKMNATPGNVRGYLLFPLRAERNGNRRDRAVFRAAASASSRPSFELEILWRGNPKVSTSITGLITVFANLGSLGFRSRRAMGALRPLSGTFSSYVDALSLFSLPGSLSIGQLKARDPDDAISVLATWLRSWRAHGRSGQNQREQTYPGFAWAKSDHDTALNQRTRPGYRAALGMPLLTTYGNWNAELPPQGKQTAGRFASPVVLRPHVDENGNSFALVIFVDGMKWDSTSSAFLDRGRTNLSLDLYEAMKKDESLAPFP